MSASSTVVGTDGSGLHALPASPAGRLPADASRRPGWDLLTVRTTG